jgi:hypothetical protein
MLPVMIEDAKVDGQIEGVIAHLVDGSLSVLQYAKDTILFIEHDFEKARNLELILAALEQISGLKINLYLYYLKRTKVFRISPPQRSVDGFVKPSISQRRHMGPPNV